MKENLQISDHTERHDDEQWFRASKKTLENEDNNDVPPSPPHHSLGLSCEKWEKWEICEIDGSTPV